MPPRAGTRFYEISDGRFIRLHGSSLRAGSMPRVCKRINLASHLDFRPQIHRVHGVFPPFRQPSPIINHKAPLHNSEALAFSFR
jgi:hypothetical protein